MCKLVHNLWWKVSSTESSHESNSARIKLGVPHAAQVLQQWYQNMREYILVDVPERQIQIRSPSMTIVERGLAEAQRSI